MYDRKTIRRRRAVLALLVVSSVVLLTASFGGNGGVGSVQRGVFELVSPIQDVASRSLKPFRDLFGWFGDTWHAKGENASLKRERNQLREQNAVMQSRLRNASVAAKLVKLDQVASLDQLGPVTARVYGAAPTLQFQSLFINRGTNSGVKVGQPVVAENGLVGTIIAATGGYSKVRLVTDQAFGASVMVARTGTPGVLRSGGAPDDLAMKTIDPKANVGVGSTVVTRGTDVNARGLPSLFPPDVEVGRVVKVDDAGTDTQVVHVRPLVDVRSVQHVQVLTRDPATIP